MEMLLILSCLMSAAMGQATLPPDWEHWPAFVPLLGGVSNPCLKQSLDIVHALTDSSNPLDSLWAWQMIDSTGKFPRDGMLSYIVEQDIDICDMMKSFQKDFNCQSIPESLRKITLKLPIGHNIAPGAIDECLNNEKVETKYCKIFIWANGAEDIQNTFDFDLKLSKMLSNFPAVKHLKRKQVPSEVISGYSKKNNNSLQTFFGQDIFNATILDVLSTQVSDILEKNCPQCRKSGFVDQLPMFLALYWLTLQGAPGSSWFGGCYSAVCTGEDIRKNYEAYTQIFRAGKLSMGAWAAEEQCLERDMQPKVFRTNHEWSSESKVIVPLFCVLAILIGVSTCVDIWSRVNPFKQDLPFTFSKNKQGESFLLKIMKAFSLYSNATILLSTKSEGRDVITCLHGLRFISMTWVVLAHNLLNQMFSETMDNKGFIFNDVMNGEFGISFEAILNGFPSVDSFFVLSGLLVAYLTFKELDRTNGIINHIIVIVMYYVHRYIRLTIPLVLIMLIIIGILPLIATGISWSTGTVGEANACIEHWRAHIGYYNNDEEGANECMGVTWYMADDMVFYWMAPLLMYPMWALTKYIKKIGIFLSVSLWFLILAAFTAYNCYLFWYNRITLDTMFPVKFGLWNIDGWQEREDHPDFYMVWYTRFQPYLVGLLLGYILHLLKGKQIKLNPVVNILMWQVCFLVAYSIVFGWYDLRITRQTSVWLIVAYNTLQRLVWGLCLAWVIFSCTKGYGGPINDFLSWKFFGPLSKLTYCCYLIHMKVMGFYFGTINYSWDFTWWNFVISFLGCLSLALGFAFILSLTLELPFIFLEKLLVGKLLDWIKSKTLGQRKGKEEKSPAIKEHLRGKTETENHKINIKNQTEEKKDLAIFNQNEQDNGLPVAEEILSVPKNE